MKVLIISQHIYPKQTPRAHRATEIAIELSRRGFQVTIYAVLGKFNYEKFMAKYNLEIKSIPLNWESSPDSSDQFINRNLLDKLKVRLFSKAFEYPNIEFYFKIPKIIKYENNHDVLISIANPHQIHWGCARAKKKHSKEFPNKWIADCGDPYMHNGTTTRHLKFYSIFEKLFCKKCEFISVPFEGAKNGYYKEFRKKILVIPQGFNFNPIGNMNLKPINKIPTFIYSGNFFTGFREPHLFFKYLSKQDIDYRFIIYTQNKLIIKNYNEIFKNKLIIKDVIERNELIKKLSKADFLINFENINYPTSMPSKLIDYGIANRPILNINPLKIDSKKINEFLNGDYKNRLKIKNINQYHIKNVADKFIQLF